MGIKRSGGVCGLRSPTDVRKEESDELELASYQPKAGLESRKTSVTEASPKADTLREDASPFQDLLPHSLVTSRPINTRTRSQPGTLRKYCLSPEKWDFYRKNHRVRLTGAKRNLENRPGNGY